MEALNTVQLVLKPETLLQQIQALSALLKLYRQENEMNNEQTILNVFLLPLQLPKCAPAIFTLTRTC